MNLTRNIARCTLSSVRKGRLRSLCGCITVPRSFYDALRSEQWGYTHRSYATRPSLVELTKDRYPKVKRKDFAQVCRIIKKFSTSWNCFLIFLEMACLSFFLLWTKMFLCCKLTLIRKGIPLSWGFFIFFIYLGNICFFYFIYWFANI